MIRKMKVSFKEKIDRIHQAVREGDSKFIQENVDKVKLALARDRKGATPLHDAILYEQTEIIRTFAQTYPQVLNAPDYVRLALSSARIASVVITLCRRSILEQTDSFTLRSCIQRWRSFLQNTRESRSRSKDT